MTTHETIRKLAGGPEAEEAGARVLSEGGLVVAPTETVYGVFASDRGALAGLAGSETAKAAAWHLPDAGAAARGLGGLSAWQRRLIGRVLPGPVTVVAGDTAVRVPEHEGCRRLLCRAGEAGVDRVFGVRLPIGDARSVEGLDEGDRARLADAGVALAIDDGATKLGAPSTVIRLTASGYELVREGAIEARYLDKLVRGVVLFVCTGNTCRSPMAAAIARDLLGDDPYTEVLSAGLSAGSGSPMTPEARAALRSIGVEPGSHRSSALSERDLTRADHVFAMTAGHLAALGEPRAQLLDPEGEDVPDPIGGPQSEYDSTCRRIRGLVRRRLEALDPAPPREVGPGDAP